MFRLMGSVKLSFCKHRLSVQSRALGHMRPRQRQQSCCETSMEELLNPCRWRLAGPDWHIAPMTGRNCSIICQTVLGIKKWMKEVSPVSCTWLCLLYNLTLAPWHHSRKYNVSGLKLSCHNLSQVFFVALATGYTLLCMKVLATKFRKSNRRPYLRASRMCKIAIAKVGAWHLSHT